MKKIITFIDKNEINTIITTLIKRIKEFFKIKYNSNSKTSEISKIFIEIKRKFLRINTFIIIDNVRLFIILKR